MRPLLNYSEDGLWLQVTEGDHLLAFHLSVQARWPSGPSLFGQKGIIRHQCAGKESAPLSIPPPTCTHMHTHTHTHTHCSHLRYVTLVMNREEAPPTELPLVLQVVRAPGSVRAKHGVSWSSWGQPSTEDPMVVLFSNRHGQKLRILTSRGAPKLYRHA